MRALLGILLVGCTADVSIDSPEDGPGESSGGGSGSDQTQITASTYLQQIAEIQCDQAFRCRDSFPPDLGYTFESVWSTSTGACSADLMTQWNPTAIETEIAKGRIMFDGAAAIACLSGVTFAACGEYWLRGIEWAEACYHVVVGMVPLGGECETDYACTSFYCDTYSHTCY